MMKLLSMVLGLMMFVSVPRWNSASAQAIIDRIEGDYAVVEFSKDGTTKMQNIPVTDINGEVSVGSKIPVVQVSGKFYGDLLCRDNHVEECYYQFKSDDGLVWWLLTQDEIGHIPNTTDRYTLYYSDNWTDVDSRVCDCPPELECECYLYDDIFFDVERGAACGT